MTLTRGETDGVGASGFEDGRGRAGVFRLDACVPNPRDSPASGKGPARQERVAPHSYARRVQWKIASRRFQTLVQEPPIPLGTPDPYVPPKR
jgi:hypothetical protein